MQTASEWAIKRIGARGQIATNAYSPAQLTLELKPEARLDVIDVRKRLAQLDEGLLRYPRCLYYSFHTTAGYLEQSLARRLEKQQAGIQPYIAVFRNLFPSAPGTGTINWPTESS